jgi:hypothetical protein
MGSSSVVLTVARGVEQRKPAGHAAPNMESRYASAVGRTSVPITYDVERGHVRRFAQAIGDANPIYHRDGDERIPAPPTFAIALRANDPREGLDIDFTKLLHGEQEFTLHRPIYTGDRLTIVGRVADAYVKEGKSGAMDMMVLENTATDTSGATVFTTRALIVIKR